MADAPTITAQIEALEEQAKAARQAKRAADAAAAAQAAAAAVVTDTPEENPTVTASTDATPTPKDVAQATGAVSAREAGTFVLIDGYPALLIEAVELIDLGDGASLDVWTVERFTPTGSEVIARHGFLDGAA